MVKEALYIENAFFQSEGTRSLKERLVERAARQGLRLIPRTNADFLKEGSFDNLPGAALFWDKDLLLAKQLEQAGLRLFNPSRAIGLCDDKTISYLHLKDSGIPMPDTLLCPLTYPLVGFTHTDFLQEVADRLRLPFVIKEGMGSFGQQVYLAGSLEEAAAILKRSQSPLLFQRFISESKGTDLRLYVVGDEVVAAMQRQNLSGDFRANINHGGQARPYMPSREERDMAIRACQALGLDFGGVDLLLSSDGPLLCEVNSNAHFHALEAVSGLSPADAIATHMLKEMP